MDILLKYAMLPWTFRGDKGLGLDYAGEVVAIGDAVAAKYGFSVGDRIAGLYLDPLGPGTLSEYIVVNPFKSSGKNARQIPQNLSYQEGAAYPAVFGTAQYLFDVTRKGNSFKKILVIGGGTSVGRFVI